MSFGVLDLIQVFQSQEQLSMDSPGVFTCTRADILSFSLSINTHIYDTFLQSQTMGIVDGPFHAIHFLSAQPAACVWVMCFIWQNVFETLIPILSNKAR